MTEYTLTTEFRLPRPRDEVFAFFAEPGNLQQITPAWLDFEILTQGPLVMRRGALIDYRIVVHGVPLRWRTEITEWDPPHRFVDVQVRGPYTLWHHTHEFVEAPGGTVCRDQVRYRPRGGAMVHRLFVRRDVERIFAHREERLKRLFAPPADSAPAPVGTNPGASRSGAAPQPA